MGFTFVFMPQFDGIMSDNPKKLGKRYDNIDLDISDEYDDPSDDNDDDNDDDSNDSNDE